MKTIRVRELGAAELQDEARKASEQLFRLRFQLKLGQNEGVKRLQTLKKDVARIKTIERERALGIRGATTPEAGATSHKSAKGKQAKAARAVKEAS
jgi:large subunit ribosomal protein L29